MTFDLKTLENMILEGIPDATVRIENLRTDEQVYYAVTITSPSFEGQTRMQQHRMVYTALKNIPKTDFHALTLRTLAPEKKIANPSMLGAMAERIYKEISRNDVVLYMNGTAAFPQCTASAVIVQILSSLGVAFKDVNVQDDGELRHALLGYADWPTVPQLYIKAEFTGGADIVREMHETGELQELLNEKVI